ncbi:MAG TPA: hypothetical protein VMG12_40030 [Polyangiaceae bacterium]|nr:hypothetical protein [Polyangiaceae bacterium]
MMIAMVFAQTVLARGAASRRARAARWLVLGSLWGILPAADAHATPEYPLVLDNFFQTSCPNPNSRCVICHTSSRGGQATAVRPFAQTLRPLGLNRGRDVAALQGALAALPDTTDSDEDGAPDKEELMMCGNPSGDDLGAGPEYGCDGAHLAPLPARSSDAPVALLSLFVASVIVWRRRR